MPPEYDEPAPSTGPAHPYRYYFSYRAGTLGGGGQYGGFAVALAQPVSDVSDLEYVIDLIAKGNPRLVAASIVILGWNRFED